MLRATTVLVVDDNPLNLEIISELLSDQYDVTLVDSGIRALELLDSITPDIILLDVMMPEMDGYETCQRVRALECGASIKIVMVSGRAMPEDIDKGIAAGADAYVTKPFTGETLLNAMKHTLAA